MPAIAESTATGLEVPLKPGATYAELDAALCGFARTLANVWFRQACLDPATPLYLSFLQTERHRPGRAHIGPDVPPGYERAIELSSAWDVDKASVRIREALQLAPILPA